MVSTFYEIFLLLSRYVQIGVASFGYIVDCGTKPGGFSRMTFDVIQWIRRVKVRLTSLLFLEKNNIAFKVDSWQHKMEMQLQKGVWCGYRHLWSTKSANITYEKLLHSSTNIENPGIGLDIQSGIIACLNHFITPCNEFSQESSQCL